MAKVIKATDGTFSETATTLLDDAITAFMLPVKAFASSEADTYIPERVAGMATLGWGVAGGLFGEAMGHKRERNGSGAILSFLDK